MEPFTTTDLEEYCDGYLKEYAWLFENEIINISYYSNMKWYLTCVKMMVPRESIREKIINALKDVEYTLNCISKGLEGQEKFHKPSRIIGLLNKVSITGDYESIERFRSGHF